MSTIQKHTIKNQTPFWVKTLFLFLIIVITTSKAKAQIDSSANRLLEFSIEDLLQMKIDVGTKMAGLGTKEIPAEVSLITRDEIRLSGARNLPELISICIPGAIGIFDADDYIFGFRGFAPDNNSMVKLLINGQDVGFSANQNSSTMMALLDLNFIERLEVITGPGSSTFGSGPLLGVINIVTMSNETETKNDARVGTRYGSGLYRDTYMHLNFKNLQGYKISSDFAMFSQTDGYKPKSGNDQWVMPAQVVADGKYHESMPGYSFFGSVEKNSVGLSLFATSFTWDNYNTSTPLQLKNMRTQGAKTYINRKLSSQINFQPSVFIKSVYFQSQISPAIPQQSADYGDELNYGTEMKLEYKGTALQSALGIIYNCNHYGYNSFGGRNSYFIGKNTRIYDQQGNEITHDDYVQMAEKKILHNFDFYSESRYALSNRYSVHASLLAAYDDAMLQTNWGPRLALFANYNKYWSKILYTYAFRTPIPMAIGNLPAGGFFRHYINPQLKTQSVQDVELHLGYSEKNRLAQLVLFYNKNEGIIMAGSYPELSPGFDPSKWAWTFVNGGTIQTIGCELTAELKYRNIISCRFSQSVVKVIDVQYEKYLKGELYTDFKGKHLYSYPENMSKLNLSYAPTRFLQLRTDMLIDYGRFRTDIISTKSIDDSEMKRSGLPIKSDNWYNFNIGAQLTIKRRIVASLHCYNVFDNRPYQNVINSSKVSTPYPRSIIGGIEYIFK